MDKQKINKRFILKSSLIIMGATLLAKIFGLAKEQYSLFLFGGSYQHDAFIAAYKLPNALRNLLAEGAFSAAFIPIFSSILVTKTKKDAFNFANKVLTLLIIVSSVVAGIGVLCAYKLVPLIYRHPAQIHLAIFLSRIMMPFIIFVSISAIIMGMLNSLHHFLFPALAPFFSNICFILIVTFTHKKYGIKSLAFGILLSGVFYFLVQLPSILRRKFRFRFNFKFKDENVKRFLKSFFPIAFGMAVFQLNMLISIRFSSPFQGASTAIDKTFIIMQLILSVFVTGISTVSLPAFSRYCAVKDWDNFKRTFVVGIRMVMFFTIPSMLGIMALNTDVAALVFKDIFQIIKGSTGKIQIKDMLNMGNCLFFFAPSMVSFGCVVILNRAFQGLKKYYIPFFTGCVSVIMNVIFITTFMKTKLSFIGIPLSISLSSIINMTLLAIVLRVKLGKFKLRLLVDSGAKIIIASVIMSGVVRLLKKKVIKLNFIRHQGTIHLLYTSMLIAIGIIIYVLLLFLFREKEFMNIWNKVKRKFGSKSKVDKQNKEVDESKQNKTSFDDTDVSLDIDYDKYLDEDDENNNK